MSTNDIDHASNDGYSAPIFRALYQARLVAGLPRDVAAVWWGGMMIPVVWGVFWVLIPGLIGHGIMAYLGRKNPQWALQLRQHLKQGRFWRTS